MVTFKSQAQYIFHIHCRVPQSLWTLDAALFARPAHDVAIGRFLFLGQTEGPHIAIGHTGWNRALIFGVTIFFMFTCSQGGDSPGDLMQKKHRF